MLSTLVKNYCVHEGSQWAVFVARVEHGPLQPLVNSVEHASGRYGDPLVNKWYSLIHFALDHYIFHGDGT